MLYAGIDIHKRVCQVVVLDPGAGRGRFVQTPFPVQRGHPDRRDGALVGAPDGAPRTASIAGPFGLGLRQLSALGAMTSSNA
jgi:hypothetical protein